MQNELKEKKMMAPCEVIFSLRLTPGDIARCLCGASARQRLIPGYQQVLLPDGNELRSQIKKQSA